MFLSTCPCPARSLPHASPVVLPHGCTSKFLMMIAGVSLARLVSSRWPCSRSMATSSSQAAACATRPQARAPRILRPLGPSSMARGRALGVLHLVVGIGAKRALPAEEPSATHGARRAPSALAPHVSSILVGRCHKACTHRRGIIAHNNLPPVEGVRGGIGQKLARRLHIRAWEGISYLDLLTLILHPRSSSPR